MLSGETAKGRFPTEAVAIMTRLAIEAENNLDYRSLFRLNRNESILSNNVCRVWWWLGISSRVFDLEGVSTLLVSNRLDEKVLSIPESIASSAVKSAWDLNSPLILCLSDSGNTVRYVSKYRPHSIILAITSSPRTARQIYLSRFVLPRE
eukprot:TRINITY_DN2004_c0_g3_i2.p1 TRINITY_DN2004_c0_g3~~TRINITY_DN2004_c0_g3_i2.p1  ORF type:complete len:150 (+),score=18.33 TRINITY_DN2004_c0_g3_i2:1307-1756(+)